MIAKVSEKEEKHMSILDKKPLISPPKYHPPAEIRHLVSFQQRSIHHICDLKIILASFRDKTFNCQIAGAQLRIWPPDVLGGGGCWESRQWGGEVEEDGKVYLNTFP